MIEIPQSVKEAAVGEVDPLQALYFMRATTLIDAVFEKDVLPADYYARLREHIVEALVSTHVHAFMADIAMVPPLPRRRRVCGWFHRAVWRHRRAVVKYVALMMVVLGVSFAVWLKVGIDVSAVQAQKELANSNDDLRKEIEALRELLILRGATHL